MCIPILLSLVPDRKIEKLNTSVEEEGEEEEEEADNIINRKKDLVKNYGKRMFRKVCCVFLLYSMNWWVVEMSSDSMSYISFDGT